MNHRDPFSSRYDRTDSIGGCGCGPSSVGLSLDIDLQGSLSSLEGEANKAIGQAAGAYADAQEAVDAAMAVGKGVENAVNELKSAGDEIGDAIIAVASSPITHGALGALAVAAPPFTTALAGIGEAALGIGVGAVELVKAAEDVWNDVFMSYEEKAAREWGVSLDEAKRILKDQKKRDEVRASFAKRSKEAEKQLAQLRTKAIEGDRNAVAALAVLDSLMKSDILLLTTIIRFGCSPEIAAIKTKSKTGLTPWNLCDVAKTLVADQTRAAGMTQKEFEFYSKVGRVTTSKSGKREGFYLDVTTQNGKQVPALIDASTGKALYTGQKAVEENSKGFHVLMNKDRKAVLTDALREDYLSVFKGTLLENWHKLDAKATLAAQAQAEKNLKAAAIREDNKALQAKLRAKSEKRLKGTPHAIGDTSEGILIKKKDGRYQVGKPGFYQITSDRSVMVHMLVLPNGKIVRSYWQEVT